MSSDEPRDLTLADAPRSVDEVSAELEQAQARLEALRSRSLFGRFAHVFMTLCAASAVFLITLIALFTLGDWVGLLAYANLEILQVIAIVVLVGSLYVGHRSVFIPKEGVDQEQQLALQSDLANLQQELRASRVFARERSRERARLQHDAHGGNLSIAASSAEGGLEISREHDPSSPHLRADEEV